ncbi:MAG: hypothetical protein HC902_10425 [Calothrix sp. SM1_5_4]|nr:hypothetical protein [Calothrix sp. SM1_5_4]
MITRSKRLSSKAPKNSPRTESAPSRRGFKNRPHDRRRRQRMHLEAAQRVHGRAKALAREHVNFSVRVLAAQGSQHRPGLKQVTESSELNDEYSHE